MSDCRQRCGEHELAIGLKRQRGRRHREHFVADPGNRAEREVVRSVLIQPVQIIGRGFVEIVWRREGTDDELAVRLNDHRADRGIAGSRTIHEEWIESPIPCSVSLQSPHARPHAEARTDIDSSAGVHRHRKHVVDQDWLKRGIHRAVEIVPHQRWPKGAIGENPIAAREHLISGNESDLINPPAWHDRFEARVRITCAIIADHGNGAGHAVGQHERAGGFAQRHLKLLQILHR